MLELNQFKNTELFRIFVQTNSRDAINIFFQNQMDLFYRVAFKYTKNVADAEDVLQSGFLGIMATAHQYKGLESDEEKLLQSWCLSVIVHCALMKIRSESTRRARERKFSSSKNFYEDTEMENTKDNNIIHQKIQNAILQLPEKYRMPIHLKYVEGFELEAIAEILKLNGNTLRSLIKRGLEKVSNQLKSENVTMSGIALIGMIEKMPIEKSPITYESIVPKIFSPTRIDSYVSESAKVSSNVVFLKAVISVAVTLLAFACGYYLFNITQANSSNLEGEPGTSSEPLTSNVSNIVETNRIWDFRKPEDRDLKTLQAKWQWSEMLNAMIPSVDDQNIALLLPIHPQTKPFVLELNMAFYKKEYNLSSAFFRVGWAHSNKILKATSYTDFSDRHRFNRNQDITVKVYFYQNFICTEMPNKSLDILECAEIIKQSEIVVYYSNLWFKKISTKTCESLPEDIMKAIENKGKMQKLETVDLELK